MLVANHMEHRRSDMPSSESMFTTGEVAAELGLTRWKLAYFVERGIVTGPTATVPGRRLFTAADVSEIRKQLADRDGRSKPSDNKTSVGK